MPNDILDDFAEYVLVHNLTRGTSEYWDARREFIGEAVNNDFERFFGHDEASLSAWQGICRTVGLKKVDKLTTVAKCRKALYPVHVNIIDLVIAAKRGNTCRRFPTREACAQYTREEDKTYPLEWAKDNPLLRRFLVHVYNKPRPRAPAALPATAPLTAYITEVPDT
ncbi:hypothetical protein HDZ31DRAFT_63671 [Schizophyllum fasciatum]